MNQKYFKKLEILMESFPYIQKFQSSLILVKLGGSLMENENILNGVLKDVAFMHCVGMYPIIVHGGGKAINKRLEKLSIPIKKTAGLRHSDEQVIKVVDEVLHNEVNSNLVKKLNEEKQKAKMLSGKDILKAKKALVINPISDEKVDLGFVGDVTEVDTGKITNLVNQGFIPVITPLGKDNSGNIYNINADAVAAKIAEKLAVRKLVFLSDVPGLLRDKDDEDSLISSLHLEEISDYIEEGVISDGMQPKVLSAVEALNAGTKKVHFVDGRVKHSLLLELFTDEGIGTEIIN